jgi:hypothetical protein
MKSLDEKVMDDFVIDSDGSVSGTINKSEESRVIYFRFNCARLTSTHATPDDGSLHRYTESSNVDHGNSTGARILPYSAW